MQWISNKYTQAIAKNYNYLLPKNFDWQKYILLNEDLALCNIDNEQAAIEHYIIFGFKEQRKYNISNIDDLPSNFNVSVYKALNPDLRIFSDKEATEHFINYGIKEKRKYRTNVNLDSKFDPKLYKLYNSDLKKLSDYEAIAHFVHHGVKEKRIFYLGYSYEEIIDQKNNQILNEKLNNNVLLINHDVSLTGAPIFLYELYNFWLKNNYFKNMIIVEPYPNNTLPNVPNKAYHFNDPELLNKIIENHKPVLIYSNSLNLYLQNLEMFEHWIKKTIFHFHEIYPDFDKFTNHKNLILNSYIKVVSEKIAQTFRNNGFTNISVFPPFLNTEKLNSIDSLSKQQDYSFIANQYRELNTDKVIIGMCGSLCQRKDPDLLIKAAQENPIYEFIWVGGNNMQNHMIKNQLSWPQNFFWIENTNNPYQYFKLFDYFFLTSKYDPCPIVVLENLYLNNKIIVIKNNIYTDHIINKLENYICLNSDTTESVLEEFKNLVLEKTKNKTINNKKYVKTYFNEPQIINKQKNKIQDLLIFSLFYQDNLDFAYYINLINQFNLRNNFSYQVIVQVSSKTNNINIDNKLKQIINLNHINYRKNKGYDIGGLLDGIYHIFKHKLFYSDSKLAYIHTKSNIYWKDINNQIFYTNTDKNIDTISSDRFLGRCKLRDLNRKIFVKYPNIFSNKIQNIEFKYVQGTVFITKLKFLEELYQKYDLIYPLLTDIDKKDTYWQNIMKNKKIFNKYYIDYNDNIFNNKIDIESYDIVVNNQAKNYLELYENFNLRGIPDCQIEHALERYIGYLITNNKIIKTIECNK